MLDSVSQQTYSGDIVVAPMSSPADARAFKDLNEQWITTLFTLEPADSAVLDDPHTAVVAKGGQVLLARDGDEIVGCVAVVREGHGPASANPSPVAPVYEISKMAVSPDHRGRGFGRILLQAAIDHARALGATTLFLGSSTKLATAVHLYEQAGFVHVPPEEIGPMPYDRADVFMRLDLTS
jgi:GNAT superfamily N-acetyltransferase